MARKRVAKYKAPTTQNFGRPSNYRPEYCQMLIDHMALGHSYVSFAAVIKSCRDTMDEWAASHQDFADAKKRGKEACNLALETIGRKSFDKGKDFNATAWIFYMKNIVGWRDKQDVTSDGEKIVPVINFIKK